MYFPFLSFYLYHTYSFFYLFLITQAATCITSIIFILFKLCIFTITYFLCFKFNLSISFSLFPLVFFAFLWHAHLLVNWKNTTNSTCLYLLTFNMSCWILYTIFYADVYIIFIFFTTDQLIRTCWMSTTTYLTFDFDL